MGASRIPGAVMKTTPGKRAEAEAKNFAASELNVPTGPMPVRIMEAFSSESTQLNPAMN